MSVKTYLKSPSVASAPPTAWNLSVVIAILMTALSIAGLVFPDRLYPTAELQQSYKTNDAVNLLLGLPILLLPMWLSRRGSLFALLCWPGALLYNLYNYTAYVFGIPPGMLTLLYGLIVVLCASGVYILLRSIDLQAIQIKMKGAVPHRVGSVLLILFGVGFLLRSVGLLIQVAMGQQVLSMADIGLLIADLLLSILTLASGALLLRQRPLGYATSVGLLYAVTWLFVGLLVIFIVQPFLTSAAFLPGDFLAVALMTIIWIIPAGIYLHRARLTR